MPEPEERLARVLQEYGRHVLTDPVALRAALRATGDGTDPDDPGAAALVAVAGTRWRPELSRPDLRTAGPEVVGDALDAAAARAAAATGLPPERTRRAVAALAGAAGLLPAGSPAAPPGPPHGEDTGPPLVPLPDTGHPQISWDGPAPARTAFPSPRPTRPLGAPGRRRWGWAAAVALVAVPATVGVLLLREAAAPTTPPPDRYAVEQVAQRYRALGAELLDGALQCAQLPAEPGELERVECGFGGFSLVLRTHDGASRLGAELDAAARGPDTVRSGRRDRDGAAIAFDEQRSGTSAFYWHVQSPRPVSASVLAPGTPLPRLAEFFDGRRFDALPRPDVPGAAFDSAPLWALAATHVDGTGATCTRVVPTAEERDAVQCTYPDGSTAQFALLADRESFTDTRVDFASQDDAYAVPGSLDVRAWSRYDGPPTGQLVQYVIAEDGRPVLYFDDDDALTYGVLFGVAGSSQADLLDRWDG